MIASFNHHESTSCRTAICNLIAIITTSPELWDLFAVSLHLVIYNKFHGTAKLIY